MSTIVEERQGFTFFRSYYEAAKELPDTQRLAFYDAVMRYGLNDEQSDLEGMVRALFILVKPNLDKSKAKAAAGSKGGRSKSESSENQQQSDLEPNDKQTQSKPQANDKQTASDKDIGYRIEDKDEETTPLTPRRGKASRRKEPRAAPDWEPERFAGFWDFYPKDGRKNKQAAISAWDKLRPNAALIAHIGKSLEKLKATENWKRGVGIPYASTFLNGARWADADELSDTGQAHNSGWMDDPEVL